MSVNPIPEGDRSGTFKDPFGHQWTVATHIEDVTEEECAKRMAAMPGGPCGEGAS